MGSQRRAWQFFIQGAKADKKVSDARVEAREDTREADYKVAAQKCDALAGADKDSCVSAAKAKFGI